MFEDINFHRAAVADHIAKSFINDFGSEDTFEKGKWNMGDTKVYQGVTWEVGGFNAKGSPLWRKKKDQSGSSSGGASAASAPMKPVSKPQGQPQASASQTNQQTSQKTYYAPKNAKIWLTSKSGGMDKSLANLGGRGSGTKEREEYIKLIIRNASSAEELAKKLNDDSSIYGKWSVNKEGFVEGEDYNGNVSVIKWAVAPTQQSAQTAAKKNDSNIIGSITKNGNRFSFNLDGKEYHFDTRTKAMEVLSLVKNMKDGKSIHDALNYLYKNYPNPVAYYAKNHLTNLGYVGLHDISGNNQEQKAHKFDPINVVLNTTRNVMKGKKPLTSFLPIPSNLGNDIKTEYYQFSNKTPEELTELENIYKRKVQNPTISDSSKKFAEKQLKVLKIFTDALGKFYSQWDD